MPRVFLPWTELATDRSQFANNGLVAATNVVPIGDTHTNAGPWLWRTTSNLAARPLGFHVHPTGGAAWRGYFGTAGALYDISNTAANNWTVTDKTRSAGGAYTATLWRGASFGDNVIMTNLADDVQYLPSPASANFTGMITSGASAPTDGMRPKAKFVFPINNNLFLAYLNLPGAFDGIASGDNPTTVAWSQTDNIRVFGSSNATPQYIGAGYQPLNYDLGYITGAIGGQYGLVAMQRGWVRIDGPSYTFRPISQGVGCQHPWSIVRFDNDVYFWGPAGPMVLRGGEGPAIPIARDKVQRAVLQLGMAGQSDPNTAYYYQQVTVGDGGVHAAACHLTRTIWFSYPTSAGGASTATSFLVYDVDHERFSVVIGTAEQDGEMVDGEFLFLGTRPESYTPASTEWQPWLPGRDLVALKSTWLGTASYRPVTPTLNAENTDLMIMTGFRQLSETKTTRVQRVRPVYSGTVSTVQAAVHSRNRPNDSANNAVVSSTTDGHGWIVFPDSKFADFHRIRVTMGVSGFVYELSGVEVEYIDGSAYGA